jgi:hemolysin III
MLSVVHEREQSHAEEIANSISHGIGLISALVGTPILILHAARHGDAGFVVGTSLFSATIILLYLGSCLYHALPVGKAKRIFRVIEHSAIFLLIAGTYMPFTFGVLRGAWGWTLFGFIWGLASVGVALKAFNMIPHPILSTGLYLLMGWLIVIAIVPLAARVPKTGLLLLIGGGMSYTAGVAFFATDSRLRYGHFIWHLFVMGGTACHYFAVLWYAA